MAIVQNFWLKGAKKRLAGSVIYKAGGQTIQRELASEVSNPRTRAQMMQRVRWANCVAFYRANASWMKYAFETKKQNQSEYNKFMSLNVANNRIYLTKQAAASGACVVDSFIMTQGSLPSISYNLSGGYIRTNIYLDTTIDLNTYSTIAELSQAILNVNPGVQEGDQISIIRYTQMVNEATSFPYVIVRKYELVLSLSNNDLWKNFWPSDIISFVEAGQDKYIALTTTGNSGGLLMVLSRTVSGKTYVSTQQILPIDNDATIAAWSSANALNRAINSYGDNTEAFLSSDSANYAENEPIELVPLAATWAGEDYAAGDYIGALFPKDGTTIAIKFNQNFVGNISHIYIDTTQASSGTIEQSSPTVSGQTVQWTISKGSIGADAIIRGIRILTDEETYEIGFAVSGGGLD